MSRIEVELEEGSELVGRARQALDALGFGAERIDAALETLVRAEPAWPAPTFDLTLREPVEFKGETYETIRLREPTGQEWEDIFEHPAKTRRRFAISRIGGVPMQVTAMIAIGDLLRGEGYLNAFFELGQTIRSW